MKHGLLKQPSDADHLDLCVHWTLFLLNIPLFILGVALVITASWAISGQNSSILSLQGDSGLFVGLVSIIIIIGIFLVGVSILGAVAAFARRRCTVLVYYVLIIVIFVLFCIGILLGYVYRQRVSNYLRQELRTSVTQFDPSQPDLPATLAWDRLQRSLQCCGVASTDGGSNPWQVWQTNKNLNSGDADSRVPTSCCVVNDGQTTNCSPGNTVDIKLIYNADCYVSSANYFRGHAYSLGACCIAFGVVLILVAMLAICHYYLAEV